MKQNYFLCEQLADPRSNQVRAHLQTKKQKKPIFDPTIPSPTQRSAFDNAGSKIKPLMGQQIEPVQAGEVSGRYLGEVDPRTPLASPLYGDLSDFPPVLIQVGSDEILLDDSVRLAQRIRAAGGKVDLEIWQGMWHVWHYFASQIPEGRLACERIGSFLHIVLGQTSPARQEREATTRESTWSWQQEAKQLRCRALELPGIDQSLIGGKRTMKLDPSILLPV